jgi:hypothetical protein
MEVPAPLVKKHIPGGMYAAYTIKNDEWDEYSMLHNWVDLRKKHKIRRVTSVLRRNFFERNFEYDIL